MKLKKLLFAALAVAFVGCATNEIDSAINEVQLPMKKVTLSADVAVDSRATVDSATGLFTWQSGDVLSVLATDGKFYNFTLAEGAGENHAEFVGEIPEATAVTTVATYPSLATNGAENSILVENTLNFTLPATWNYTEGSCNVPMVASFAEGAEYLSFKQVGGVMRFPVKNLPKAATFVVTMEDKTIAGSFPVDITSLGESCMVAGAEASVVTVNYTSDVYGGDAEFNIPVPVGTYNKFNVTIKDAAGDEIITKNYTAENKVSRATLLNMKEIIIPESAVEISEVWPYFVDARVMFAPIKGIETYALYIDGATTPIIAAPSEFNGRTCVVIGGNFEHGTTHTVAIAKVIDGVAVEASKSDAVSFTTGKIRQMTYNTGTKFVCAAWDDVAIGVENSPVYDETTQRWSIMKRNTALTPRDVRGYRVQLYAADKTTKLYDEVPFSGQVDYGGAFCDSSWIGKIEGENVMLPSALTFGWLEPGQKYYIRVQTLAEPVVFDAPANGYFKPNGDGVTMTSLRGGCAWSNFVELTTDAPHVPTDREVFYEGFDDMMFNSDIMNVAPAAVPQILTTATSDSNYKSTASAALYKAWAALPFAQRKFSEQGFNTMLSVEYYGLSDDAGIKDTPRYLNSYAGSLEGWSVVSGKANTRSMHPNFGSVRLGEKGTTAGKVELRTKPIYSDKLYNDRMVKCIVKAKVSAHATTAAMINRIVGIYHYRLDETGTLSTLDNKTQIDFSLNSDGTVNQLWSDNYSFTDESNYKNYSTWFEVTREINLQNGDIISFEKVNHSDIYGGCITIGEVTIEVAPKDPDADFEDDGLGTEPDDTNYDVYGLGEFPISYWYTVEPNFYHENGVFSYELAKQRYQEVKDAGFNIEIYWGHHTPTDVASNKRIHDICEEVGLKFIGNVGGADNTSRIQAIKENFGNSSTYVGELLGDEPGIDKYEGYSAFVKEYNAALPNKEVYINLFPQYANTSTQLKADYETYINSYLEMIPTKSLSYDFYGLVKAANDIHTKFYSNLDLVRDKTLKRRMPFWVITQSCEAPGCRYPNECDQRWSVWANIAVGSKGISYFCYGTPTGSTWESILDLNGNKTDMYYWVQRINNDIKTVGKKLIHCHADGAMVAFTVGNYPLFVNDGNGRTKYGPVTKFASGSGHQVLCGCFRDARRSENGPNYKGYKLLVTSLKPGRECNAVLTLNPNITTITVTHNNLSEVVQLVPGLDVKVGDVKVGFSAGKLSLVMPDGEAALVEF